jgi:hypothetical protein
MAKVTRESYYVIQKPIWHDPKVLWLFVKVAFFAAIGGMIVYVAGCQPNQTGTTGSSDTSQSSVAPEPCRTLEIPASK